MREHPFAVFGREVGAPERDAEFRAYGQGVLAIGVGMAPRLRIIVFPVQHEKARNLVAGLLQQQGGHR
jgi:hypothetical protein